MLGLFSQLIDRFSYDKSGILIFAEARMIQTSHMFNRDLSNKINFLQSCGTIARIVKASYPHSA